MLKLAHDAIQRHQTQPAMLYISLDQVHTQRPVLYCSISVTLSYLLKADHPQT